MDNLRKNYLTSVETLKQAAQKYYIDGKDSDLTDEEYDLLVLSVNSMGEAYDWTEHSELADAVAAGAQVTGGDKVKHRERMLSLDKAQDAETLEKFLTKMRDVRASVLLEPKLDGSAIVATYQGGELVQVATRGDSREGQNVTSRALEANIAGLPHSIDYKGHMEVRGEMFMMNDDFITAQKALYQRTIKADCKQHNRKNCEEHTQQYKNSRNATSGMILSKDKARLEGVTLTFGTYDVIPVSGESVTEDSYTKLLALGTDLGFITAASLFNSLFASEGMMKNDNGSVTVASPTSDTIHDRVEKFGEMKGNVNFPTDGIVVKVDSLAIREKLGAGERAPRWAIAYKYEAEIKETTLRRIVRNVGRTGAISYVAEFDPLELAGSEVGKATLNNSRFIEALDLHIGDTIMVRKANEIIPEIVSVVFTARKGKEGELTRYIAPATCPNCSEDLDTTSSIIWRCNNPECAVANRIIHAVNRTNLDIDGISSRLIEGLLDNDLINDVTDLYKLTVEQLAEMPTGRFYATDSKEHKEGDPILVGELMAKKHYQNIQESKDRDLNRIISSLGVRFLGKTFSSSYAKHFKSFDKIVNASVAELQGIGKVKDKAIAIRAGFDAMQPLLAKYREVGFLNMDTVEEVVLGSSLAGEIVVVTGTVPDYGRDEVKDLIAAHGGVAGGSVSSKTTLVVAPEDERDTSKAKKAMSLGITIITPEKFLGRL